MSVKDYERFQFFCCNSGNDSFGERNILFVVEMENDYKVVSNSFNLLIIDRFFLSDPESIAST